MRKTTLLPKCIPWLVIKRSQRSFQTVPATLPIGVSVTHEVKNQPLTAWNGNAFESDDVLQRAVSVFAPNKTTADISWLTSVGQWAGSELTAHDSYLANNRTPVLHNYDAIGRRVDVVEYDDSYHRLFRSFIELGIPSRVWRASPNDAHAHTIRGAGALLAYQADPGISCPATMTFAGVSALRLAGGNAFQTLVEKAVSLEYDPSNMPFTRKRGVTLGMSMTEKQGGSDVRSNTTRAVALSTSQSDGAGAAYALQGHKWFTSAPMCDAFLTLAYIHTDRTLSHKPSGSNNSPEGLSCFVVPRWLPDERRNSGFRVIRLKEKLADRSNASSEVEYDGSAVGFLLGPPGRGVATILDMVMHTRLDCALGSAGLMRQAVREATHHVTHRRAFGTLLKDAPAMRVLLNDLHVESSAAVSFALHTASVFDECRNAPTDTVAESYRRLVTALSKFFVCKRAAAVTAEALEVCGGNAFTVSERWKLERWYRQAPLNSLWEGAGNVVCLDVLRTFAKEPMSAQEAFKRVYAACSGSQSRLATHVRKLETTLRTHLSSPFDAHVQSHARWITEQLAMVVQGASLASLASGSDAPAESVRLYEAWERRMLPGTGFTASLGAGYGISSDTGTAV